MKVYFTGAPTGVHEYLSLMAGRRVMYSYVSRGRSVWTDASRFAGVALDSGAYSVWRRDAKVDIGEYADYCAAGEDAFDWYASLDVIGDWRRTLANQAALERRGLEPVPTFHLGEPWGLLDDLVSGYEKVALGRGPGMKFAVLWRHLTEIFTRCCDEDGMPLVRFHGFRMTERRLMARFPFESVDSTTWIAGIAFGQLPTEDGRMRAQSFLSASTRARVWLDFFDAAVKAERFDRTVANMPGRKKRRSAGGAHVR